MFIAFSRSVISVPIPEVRHGKYISTFYSVRFAKSVFSSDREISPFVVAVTARLNEIYNFPRQSRVRHSFIRDHGIPVRLAPDRPRRDHQNRQFAVARRPPKPGRFRVSSARRHFSSAAGPRLFCVQ